MSSEQNELTSGQKSAWTRLLNQTKGQINSLMEELNRKAKEIDDLHSLLIIDDDAEGEGFKTQFENALEMVNEHVKNSNDLLSQITDYHTSLIDSETGLITKIQSSHVEIEEEINEVKEIIEPLFEAHHLLYGNDSDEGLISNVDQHLSESSKELSLEKSQFQDIKSQIEGALTGATNVELAKEFKDKKESYKFPILGWTLLFVVCITLMVYFAFGINESEKIGQDFYIFLVKRLALISPIIWLAFFASRQRRQNKRLKEEYSHKETLAKTYLGHKKQIEKITSEGDKDILLTKLADSIIETVQYNPSSTLDGNKDKEDIPSAELLYLIKQAIEKIK